MSEVLIVFTGTHISQHLYWIQIFQSARLLFLRLFMPTLEAFYASTRSILCQAGIATTRSLVVKLAPIEELYNT